MNFRHMFPHWCFLWLVFTLASASMSGAEWGRLTEEEYSRADSLIRDISKTNNEAAWRELASMNPRAFLSNIYNNLPSWRDEPEKFERLRGMVLAIPDWEGWVQWKIGQCHAWMSDSAPPEDPNDLDSGKEWPVSNHTGYMVLTFMEKFLPMIGTVETVPLVAQFLSFPYGDGMDVELAFPQDAAYTLYYMQIPGAPHSSDVEVWKRWWKENEHLYKKSADGKIHGPAPTRFEIMNGKRPPHLPLPGYEDPPEAPEPKVPVPATEAPGQKPSPTQATASLPVATAEAPRTPGRWLLPTVLISGAGILTGLILWLRRQKGR